MKAKRFAVYKATKRLNGAAVRFDFNPGRESIFLEAAAQRSEQEFDWDNKIVLKLGASDIGKLLAVLEGKASAIDVYHEPGKSPFASGAKGVKNAALAFSRGERGFFLKVSQQTVAGAVRSIAISLSEDEGILLRVLLQRAVQKIFSW